MIEEKNDGHERAFAGFVPNDLLRAEIDKTFPVLLKQVLLVAKVRVESRATNACVIDQVLDRDVVKTLFRNQLDHRVRQTVPRALGAPIRLFLSHYHRNS